MCDLAYKNCVDPCHHPFKISPLFHPSSLTSNNKCLTVTLRNKEQAGERVWGLAGDLYVVLN